MHPSHGEKGEGDLLWKLWNKEVKESIQTKGLAKNSQGVKESRQECWIARHTAKREMAKRKACSECETGY